MRRCSGNCDADDHRQRISLSRAAAARDPGPGQHDRDDVVAEVAHRRRLAAGDALGADGDDAWVHVVATFDDRVVVSHYEGKGQSHKYEMTYTMVGEDVTLGEPMPVKITETLEPDVEAPDPGADPPGHLGS